MTNPNQTEDSLNLKNEKIEELSDKLREHNDHITYLEDKNLSLYYSLQKACTMIIECTTELTGNDKTYAITLLYKNLLKDGIREHNRTFVEGMESIE